MERLIKEEGTSINRFVTRAVAEIVSTLQSAQYFPDRQVRADLQAFERIRKRTGGEPPRDGVENPA